MHLCCQGEESLSWSKRALLLREKISRLDPNGRTTVNDLLVSLLGLLPQTQDPVEAKRMLDLASEQAERWAELASEDPQSLIMLSRVCLAYCDYYSDERQQRNRFGTSAARGRTTTPRLGAKRQRLGPSLPGRSAQTPIRNPIQA